MTVKDVFLLFFVLGSLGCAERNGEQEPAAPKPVEGTMDEGARPEPETMPGEMKNIVEQARSNPNFSTLVSALEKAGLVETLEGPGPFTVFAPTNAAFDKLPKETLYTAMADKEQLTAILKHHVVSGRLEASDVQRLKAATMLDGAQIPIDTTMGVTIGAAKVTQADVMASNGVIHVIDTVMMPE